MIENYITILCFFIVLRGTFIIPYIKIMRKTRLAYKGRKFLLNKWLSNTDANTWRIFWASVLWLIVYFKNILMELITLIVRSVQ